LLEGSSEPGCLWLPLIFLIILHVNLVLTGACSLIAVSSERDGSGLGLQSNILLKRDSV
jgi:hypothetical protein